MIRTDRLALDTDTFAARRRPVLQDAADRLYRPTYLALVRVGLRGWQDGIMEAALDIFDEAVAEENDERTQAVDDLRDMFAKEVGEALTHTSRRDGTREQQAQMIAGWVATAALNAGVEAAVAADPDTGVGVEWVSMEDGKVRPAHREAHGQQTPTGGTFEVGGFEFNYPGQPVGPIDLWAYCRCVLRPARLDDFAARTEEHTMTAAAPELPDPAVPEAPVEEVEPDVTEEDLYLPVPWYGVLAPEGVKSGDGRGFAVNALTHRDLPLPLKFMLADDERHKGSIPVANIERIWRDNGLIKAEGTFDQSPAAYEAIRMVANRIMRGVSVDVDNMVAYADEDGNGSTAEEARIAGATICAIPAFQEAFVALGYWSDVEPEAAPAEVSRQEQIDILNKDLEQAGASVGERAGETGTFASDGPGLKEDGTPPSCKFCDQVAVGYVLHSEGMAYVPFCATHKDKAVDAAERSTPDGSSDPSNVDRVAEYTGEFAPVPAKTKDGPGWITHPRPTKKITDYWVDGPGAAKIGWGIGGDFNRCRVQLAKYVQNPDWLAGLCANLHYRALRIWPGEHAGRTTTMTDTETTEVPEAVMASAVTLVETDARPTYPADWFKDPQFQMGTPLTVTREGRVFGHVATWDVCHIGIQGECQTAPRSETDYSYFLLGEADTDAGPVSVGQITLGGGHAPRGAKIQAAMAHYDSTSTAVADITVGEDEFGIWFSGGVRPGTTEEQIAALKGAKISGDWRRVATRNGQANLEMVAALAVNVPGFPIPRPALVASGGVVTTMLTAHMPDGEPSAEFTADPSVIRVTVQQTLDEIAARQKRAQMAHDARATLNAEATARRVERARKARAAFNLVEEG